MKPRAAAVLFLALGACGSDGMPRHIAALGADTDRLMFLAGRAEQWRSAAKALPMKNGRLDVYALLEGLDLSRGAFRSHAILLFSGRAGRGPTQAEIDAGDYADFPWERCRAEDVRSDGKEFALLWEREPDHEGRRLVGFSGGTVRRLDAAAFAALRGRLPGRSRLSVRLDGARD